MFDRVRTIIAQVPAPSANDVGLPQVAATDDAARTLKSVIFGAVAAVAIIVIIFASFNFVTGGDDPEKISRSKKAIIYAFVGLALAASAEAIVLFALESIGG